MKNRTPDTRAAEKAWKARQRKLEQRQITRTQRAVGVLLIVLGIVITATGLFGWLAGDLQFGPLRAGDLPLLQLALPRLPCLFGRACIGRTILHDLSSPFLAERAEKSRFSALVSRSQ